MRALFARTKPKAVTAAAAPVLTLPQYLLTTAGSVIEGFEAASDWTVAGGGTAVDDAEHDSGSGSIKTTVGVGVDVIMTKTVNLDLSASYQNLRLCAKRANLANGSGRLVVYVANDSGWAAYAYADLGTFTQDRTGWQTINIPAALWATEGAFSWANPVVLLRVRHDQADAAQSVYLDSLRAGVVPVPAVALTFDDGLSSVYSAAFAYMDALGVRATAYIISDNIGTAGCMSAVQIKALYDGGWTVGNHSKTHAHLATLTQAEQETELDTCRDALVAAGCTNGGVHVAYPYGESNADTYLAMAAQGMLSGRTVEALDAVVPFNDAYRVPILDCSGLSLAQIEAVVDTMAARKQLRAFLFHALGAGGLAVADYEDLVDYLIASGVIPVTFDDLQGLATGTVDIPIPTGWGA